MNIRAAIGVSKVILAGCMNSAGEASGIFDIVGQDIHED
jgi:hypothetical protein